MELMILSAIRYKKSEVKSYEKKHVLIMTCTVAVAGAAALTLSSAKIYGNDNPVSMSKEEVTAAAEVTDEELNALEERGISYDDIVTTAEQKTDDFYNSDTVQYYKDSRFLFLSDGSMAGGNEMSSDSELGTYDPNSDPNAVSWDEAKELTRLRNIKAEVGYALKDE